MSKSKQKISSHLFNSNIGKKKIQHSGAPCEDQTHDLEIINHKKWRQHPGVPMGLHSEQLQVPEFKHSYKCLFLCNTGGAVLRLPLHPSYDALYWCCTGK